MNEVFPIIDVVFAGICKGCRYADLEVKSFENSFGEKFNIVKCSHERACVEARRKALRDAERGTNDTR